jgi:hypothetical protein
MSWTVVWLPGAERELAELWLEASDRNAVTEAAHWIDQRLKSEPENEGESRPDGRRILFAAPLGVIFRAISRDQRVVVSHVWKFKTSE